MNVVNLYNSQSNLDVNNLPVIIMSSVPTPAVRDFSARHEELATVEIYSV